MATKNDTTNVMKHLQHLGKKAKCRVTEMTGVITSVCFDLYGCICVCLSPGLNKEGKLADSYWLDISRVEILSTKPVMTQPDFVQGTQAEGRQGAADKPAMRH